MVTHVSMSSAQLRACDGLLCRVVKIHACHLGLIMAGCRLTLTLSLVLKVMLWAYKTLVSVSFCIRVGLLKWFVSALTCLYIIVWLVIGRVFFYCTILRLVQVFVTFSLLAEMK
jgi:hypothetical protein